MGPKSFYKHMTKDEKTGTSFPFRKIWGVKVPPRVTFFAWEADRVHSDHRQIDEKG